MLTQIGLKNFKLHVDTKIDAAPLTVFIGPNNSGKSSVFQALLLWRQAAGKGEGHFCPGSSRQEQAESEPYVFPESQLIDIGTFDQVIRPKEREIAISLSGKHSYPIKIEYGPGPTEASFEVRIRENQMVYHKGSAKYEIESMRKKDSINWEWRGPSPNWGPHLPVDLPFPGGAVQATMAVAPGLNLLTGGGLSVPSSFPPEQQLAVQEFARRLGGSVIDILKSIHMVFPLRGFEEAAYPQAPAPSATMDRMAVADRTIALLSILDYNRDIERRLSSWLENLVGINIEIKRLPGFRVTLLSSPIKGRQVPSLFSNEGTGTSQLPFILVPIGLTPPGESILLSEPEVHLHPKLQVQLAALLIRLMKEEKRQFFIETHSEHVLHAMLNAIAAGTIEREDLAIYYFENGNGISTSTRLEIDGRGGVKGGLPGFFDQSLGELAEYLDALKTK